MKYSILILALFFFAFKTGAQTLQNVTDNGNTTSRTIQVNTGSEALSLIGNSYLSFRNAGNTSRVGYLQHDGNNLVLSADVGNIMINSKVGIGTHSPFSQSLLHIKSQIASPWAFLTEAYNSLRIIAMGHTGTTGVIAVSYINDGGYSPLQLWTSNVPRLTITTDGNLGVGTEDPKGYKLAVNGNIRAKEIKVENDNWPDYVFAKDYTLPFLTEIEKHIKEKGHLPGIPSAEEVRNNGVDLGEMNAKLLQKIEELTLYLIEKEKKDKDQQEQIDMLKKQVEKFFGSKDRSK